MSTYNSHTIIGRLGQDPGVRYTQSNTAVANLNVATTEKFKDRNGEMQEVTTWHKVTLWGRKAEVAQEYLKKGSLIHASGPVEHRKWTDKDGVERVSVEIKALTMTMLDSKGAQSSPQPEPSGAPLNDVDIDDSLPF